MIEFEKENYKGHKISPGLFILDAQAMAMVKKVKQHNGSKSCPYCTIVGRYEGRMCFPQQNRDDPTHHTTNIGEIAPLEKLKIDMIAIGQFSPDYLHICCLGITKKLLLCLTSNPKIKFHKNVYQRAIFFKTELVNIRNATTVVGIS